MEALSIGEIKKRLSWTPVSEIPAALKEYDQDGRAGVKKLCLSFEKKYNAYLAELDRLADISRFEEELYQQGYQYIAGIDEVGRGPLAGPVVTAAVILPRGCRIPGINDSKKLSAHKREELYEKITEEAVSYAFGVVSPGEIDAVNILQATYKAMRISLETIEQKPDFVLADAVTIPGIEIPQRGIIQGDAKSISIGAASIIAKVTRDTMMEEMDKLYPEYGFAKNKGYGSAEHIAALKKYGPCPIHRRSFIKNFI